MGPSSPIRCRICGFENVGLAPEREKSERGSVFVCVLKGWVGGCPRSYTTHFTHETRTQTAPVGGHKTTCKSVGVTKLNHCIYLGGELGELAVLNELAEVEEGGVLGLRHRRHERDDGLGDGLLVLKAAWGIYLIMYSYLFIYRYVRL